MTIEEVIKHLEVLLECTKELNEYYISCYDDWSKQIKNGEAAINQIRNLCQPTPMNTTMAKSPQLKSK